ncbi:MAG: hypothetical protein ACRBBP_05885 [Bdellovibrionales bacterium]
MNNVDFHTKNENHDLSRIHFRCPSCSKLYSSDPARIYVESPEYTCSGCEADFSISLLQALENVEIVGNLITKPQAETVELPKIKKAAKAVAKKEIEDIQQEFNFEALESGDVSFSALVEENFKNEFEEKWAQTLEGYENRELHKEFISFCKSADNLDFAIDKYARITEVNPHDKIAASFLKKIELGVEARMTFESVRNAKIFNRSFYITLGIVCFGLLMVFIGTLWLQNKNIAGLGLGLIFFTFAAKAFFQPRQFGE